jgi:Trk K+ transport system NAD-binding subunit
VLPRPDEVVEQGDELIVYSQTLDVERVSEALSR